MSDPLRITCGEDSLVVNFGQRNDNGLYLTGPALADELGLVDSFHPARRRVGRQTTAHPRA